jgi:predicted AAA+ superfamily ATPase
VLNKYIYRYVSPLLHRFPKDTPGVYIVTGGRQVDKTTLAKQWMEHPQTKGMPCPDARFLVQ